MSASALGTNLQYLESHTVITLGMEQSPPPERAMAGRLPHLSGFKPAVGFRHGHPQGSTLSWSAFPLSLSFISPCFFCSSLIRFCCLCIPPDVTLSLSSFLEFVQVGIN